MLNNYMKYFVTATVLSCLVLTDARLNAFTAKSEIAAPSITKAAVVVSAATSSLPSVVQSLADNSASVLDIEVVSSSLEEEGKEEEEEEADSEQSHPSLSSLAEEAEKAEEAEEEQQLAAAAATETDEETPSPTVQQIDENMYAAAGLAYNKDVDLPVFKQRTAVPDEENPPVPQVTACRGVGQIAITYSEGPSNATARIARQLNDAKISGNFFVNTKWLNNQDYAMVLQNNYNAGHFIGMTYRLPSENPESMSNEEIKADIINSARMIETLIQVAPKYVRLHFSAQSDGRTENILKELGFILVGYNLDGKDYVHKSPELVAEEYTKMFAQYRLNNQDKKGSFVAIQYDIPETISLTAVPNILQVIEKEGYNAVRMDGCLNDSKPYKSSAAGLEYVSDKFSFGSAGYKDNVQKTTSSDINASEQDHKVAAAAAVKDGEKLNAASSTSGAAAMMALPKNIGFVLIPALVYAIVSQV